MSGYSDAGRTTPVIRPESEPIVDASFRVALGRYFEGFTRGSGRASKSEYWWPYAGLVIVLVAAVFLLGVGSALGDASSALLIVGSIAAMVAIVSALGTIALSVRRLHDANLSGWWYLLALAVGMVPIAGVVPVVLIGLLPSRPEGARFDSPKTSADHA